MTTPTSGTVGHLKVSTLVAKPCTKFEVCSFSHSKDISWGVKFQSWSLDPDHAPFRDGLSVTDRLGHAMANLHTKFEVPIFTRYAKC